MGAGNLVRELQGRALIEVEALCRCEASGRGRPAESVGIKRWTLTSSGSISKKTCSRKKDDRVTSGP